MSLVNLFAINLTADAFLSKFQIVGVSILRAGETMEQALCEVYKNVRLGKILIQTNLETEEPEVGTSSLFITKPVHEKTNNQVRH